MSSPVLHGGVLSSHSALHESSAAFLLYSGMSLSHSCSSFVLPFYLSISHNASFPAAGACGLRWQVAMTVPLIGAGGPAGRDPRVGSSQRPEEEGWTTHLLLLTAVSRPALWNSFIPRPHDLSSAMSWHWVQSYTCSPSPALCLSVFHWCPQAMWDIHFLYRY